MPAATPKLRNIGPKSAAWLRQVGLRTEADLVAIGPVEAFMRVRRAGFKPTMNLLYALEGARPLCHRQDVPEPRRQQPRRKPKRRSRCCRRRGTARRGAGDHDRARARGTRARTRQH